MHLSLRDDGSGISRDSLRFFREHRHELGEATSVAVRFPGYGDPYDPYNMVIHDDDYNEMLLSGCTCGYAGEGPRAAMLVLIELGFDPYEAELVFTEPQVALSRNPRSRPVAPTSTATPRSSRPVARTRSTPAQQIERDL